jgi:glycosyltransferase involved in cell wall biosynthesis
LFHYWALTQIFLAHLIRHFQKNDPLVFVFSYPYYHSLAKQLNGFSIYYNVDDYQHYWKGRERQTQNAEDRAVNYAGLVVCVAQYRANQLRRIHSQKGDRIIHIPHGCSPQFMVDHPLEYPNPLPAELRHYSRPIAGYIGTLNYRFDFAYLAQVAAQLPDVTFVLGGALPQPQEGSENWWQGVEQVRQLSNVHFIGAVSHQQLGEYLQSFDLLLMIYSECNFNLNACPTKLWDYMGTSLPIVANNVVPEVNRWNELILISKHPEEFAKNINEALKEPGIKAKRCLEVARKNVWTSQAKKLQIEIEKFH